MDFDAILSFFTSASIAVVNFYRSVNLSFSGVSINVFDLAIFFLVIEVIWYHFNGGSDD